MSQALTITVPDALSNHTGVVGKTRSGKTSTAKLIVEQVAAAGARVCILDPLKSDWWGLTSSADGKRPGLPFQILGGPRGHLALPATAGGAIGSLVGRGELPLSILDMADFEPGEHARFFIDFARSLFKEARGVVYLVIEEAHVFAPKERGGEGPETMALHWAKRLGTGAGSKGIRLIVCTQRTQELHNAVLGSCESLIVHRLTLPADKRPVVEWFKGNTDKATAQMIDDSLSSLKTGEAWECLGESKILTRRQYPRIATFDNSKTPTSDAGEVAVTTAAIDVARLEAVLGEAVEVVKASDPKLLRKRVAELEAELDRAKRIGGVSLEEKEAMRRQIQLECAQHVRGILTQVSDIRGRLECVRAFADEAIGWCGDVAGMNLEVSDGGQASGVGANAAKVPGRNGRDGEESACGVVRQVRGDAGDAPHAEAREHDHYALSAAPARGESRVGVRSVHNGQGNGHLQRVHRGGSDGEGLGAGERSVLTAIAQHSEGVGRDQLTVLTGYKRSSRDTYIQRLASRRLIDVGGGMLQATAEGVRALGPEFERLPTGRRLRDYWCQRLTGGERAIFELVLAAYPRSVDREAISERTSYKRSARDTYIQRLAQRRLVMRDGSGVKAVDTLF